MITDDDDELRRIYKTLGKDIIDIIGKSKLLSQFKRRSFIRALVSLIEFDTYNRKQRALYLHEHYQPVFDISELILLREISAEVDSKGRVKERQKFIRLTENYCFAIRMFCKAADIGFKLDFGGSGWSAFKATIELRNSITHPKKEQDITISDEALSTAMDAYVWVKDNYKAIVELMDKQFQETT